MPIQCQSCKAYLAISDPLECPRCRAPLPRLPRAEDVKASARAVTSQSTKTAFSIAIVGAIVIGVGLIVYRMAVPSAQQIHDRQVAQALARCQQRIVSTAQYGEAETPPFTKNYGKGDEFYFAWPTGSFHFKNGFGAPLKMSASCVGNVSTGEIKQLTLNGMDLI